MAHGEYFDNEESVKEAKVAVIILKDKPVVTENKLKQL
jgi:hypothetical protein